MKKAFYYNGKLLTHKNSLIVNNELLQKPTTWKTAVDDFTGVLAGRRNGHSPVVLDCVDVAKHYDALSTLFEHLPKRDIGVYLTYGDEPVYEQGQLYALHKLNQISYNKFKKELLFPNGGFQKIVSLNTSWDFSKVLKANQTLDTIASEIKLQKLTPYEQYLAVYSWVTSFRYNMEHAEEDYGLSRRVVEVLNGNKIVCVGYVQLMVYVCKKLGIPCAPVGVSDNNGLHEIMMVDIEDKKYGISGIYLADPTNDSVIETGNPILKKRYCFTLVPPTKRVYNYLPYKNEVPFDFFMSLLHNDQLPNFSDSETLSKFYEKLEDHDFFTEDGGKNLSEKAKNRRIIKIYKKALNTKAVSWQVLEKGLTKVFEHVNFNYHDGVVLLNSEAKEIAKKIVAQNKENFEKNENVYQEPYELEKIKK